MLVLGLDWEHLVTDKPCGHSKDLISVNSVALGVGQSWSSLKTGHLEEEGMEGTSSIAGEERSAFKPQGDLIPQAFCWTHF